MTHERARLLYPSKTPRFNHVAMSVPADLLGASPRADLCRFWGEVFGFDELAQMTEDRHRLVLSACHYEQFVFIIADDHPMTCPRMDHYGMSVGSLADLEAAHERATAFAASDDRVDLTPIGIDDHGVVRLHSFYTGFLLPMMLELQFWEFTNPTPDHE